MNITNPRVTDLEIGRDPGGNTDSGEYILQAIRRARDGQRIRVTLHGSAIAMIIPVGHEPGPETLRAFAYGDSMAAIEADALEQARELYGPGTGLEITHTGTIHTGNPGRRGRKFAATVTIRCITEDAGQQA